MNRELLNYGVTAILYMALVIAGLYLVTHRERDEPQVFRNADNHRCIFVHSKDPEHTCANPPKHARVVYLT